MAPKTVSDPTPKVTLPMRPTTFYIGTTQVGTISIDASKNPSFQPTSGAAQGPWTLNLNVTSGSVGNSSIAITVGTTTYDRITGNIADNSANGAGRGGGTLHQANQITGTDASWSTDGTGTT